MPIKVDLIGDTPGVATLRIVGLGGTPPTDGMMRLVRPNSKTYLGEDGQWYGEEKWLPLPPLNGEGSALIGQVGARLVDALALLGPSDVVGLAVRTDSRMEEGRVKTSRLLSSGLEHDPSADQPVATEAPTEAPTEEPTEAPTEEPTDAPAEEITEAPQDTGSLKPSAEDIAAAQAALASLQAGKGGAGKGLKIALFVLLGLLLLGGLSYLASLILMGLNEDQAVENSPSATSLSTREDVAAYLALNPSNEDAMAQADALTKGGHPDLGLLIYKYAQRNGDQDASMALAKMYDPETWTAETSPMPQADAETATFWYEPAANAGNVEAQRRMGEILTSLYPSGFQYNMGVTWLEKAAQAGDAKAQAALDKLK